MKPTPPRTGKRTLRRLILLALLVAVLIGAGLWVGKRFPRAAEVAGPGAAVADSAGEKAWRKANPWLFMVPEYEPFREPLILPLARAHGLAPRGVRKRGALVEMTFAAGRPLHEYAYALEARCADAGISVIEGREIGADAVEYKLKDAQARPLTLRLVMGKSALPGSVRMSLVVTGLGAADDADLAAWLKFPGVTLVLPDTAALLKRGGGALDGREIFIELPMEPASYPYVKPGPRALFIDFSRDQAEKVLRDRLDAWPSARGFATTHGDRAIENPVLMENVLNFMAAHTLVFLDLTGSPISQTAALSVKSGAESFTARAQDAGPEKNLEAELTRRLGLAKKAGEGVWVLRHAPGLPALLSKLFARQESAFDELGLVWVPLGELRRDKED